MTIGIDGRLWNQTGIGRYVRNLVLNLLNQDKRNEYVLFVIEKDEEDIKNQISKLEIKNLKLKIVSVNVSWHSFSEQVRFPKILNKEKLNLMHFPYFNVPIFYKGPYVITVHDLVYHHFMTGKASTLPIWLYGFKMLAYRIVIGTAARKAKKIIAVSNSTKREIMNHLRVDGDKVDIVYEAADDFSAKGSESSGRKSDNELDIKNYFLYVGNIYPHKNTERLLEAFKIFSKENDTKLIFVGKEDYFYKNLKKGSRKMIEEGKIIIIYDAPDKKLYTLYKNAICLVRPSLMEGFSLPPLEALSCRCLVLASKISVHKEIFGDSIIYFDPYNTRDIIDKMGYVYGLDKKTRDGYIERGISLTWNFSWEKTARQTLKVYEDSIGIRQNK